MRKNPNKQKYNPIDKISRINRNWEKKDPLDRTGAREGSSLWDTFDRGRGGGGGLSGGEYRGGGRQAVAARVVVVLQSSVEIEIPELKILGPESAALGVKVRRRGEHPAARDLGTRLLETADPSAPAPLDPRHRDPRHGLQHHPDVLALTLLVLGLRQPRLLVAVYLRLHFIVRIRLA